MDNYIFLAVIFTKVISFKIESKVMARCFGLMVVFTKDNGKMVLKMEKGRYTSLEETLLVEYSKIAF